MPSQRRNSKLAGQLFSAVVHFCCAPARVAVTLVLICSALGSAGCTRNPYPVGYPGQYPIPTAPGTINQVTPNAPPPAGYPGAGALGSNSPQLLELQRRVQQLDDNNRQLTTQIAQAQQQTQAYRERADLLAKQLQDASNQNQQLLAAAKQYQNHAQGMQASMQQMQSSLTSRGGARLTANNSLSNSAAGLQIAGAQIVPDGDLIRIRLPADQLFTPGSATPSSTSSMMLDQVAGALLRQYPRQRVGIEGHTDTMPLAGGATTYQLASAQAQSVMDHLVRRSGVPSQQLFIIAHGPNHPIADNQSAVGRAENRRIEIVIYPETY